MSTSNKTPNKRVQHSLCQKYVAVMSLINTNELMKLSKKLENAMAGLATDNRKQTVLTSFFN